MPKTETNSSEKFEHNLHTCKVQVLEHLEKVMSLKGKLQMHPFPEKSG